MRRWGYEMNIKENIYKRNGYENRTDYMENIAEEYEIPFDAVEMFAEMLGEGKDFDGLVSILQDYN